MANLQGWHLIILLVVILLLFGAAKLPALARSMGQSARAFKHEMKEMRAEDSVDTTAAAPGAAPVDESAVPGAAADPNRSTT